jgi:addiction module HigA family antidote
MNNFIDTIEEVIHPGQFIKQELRKKYLTQRALAKEVGISFQAINAIILGRRKLTTEQALRIDQALGCQDGFLAILQTHYEIKQCREKGL